jgi:hypothetical protein
MQDILLKNAYGWRYAAYRINTTDFSAYKYIKPIHVSFTFTNNCGMQYKRMLAFRCLLLSQVLIKNNTYYFPPLKMLVGSKNCACTRHCHSGPKSVL